MIRRKTACSGRARSSRPFARTAAIAASPVVAVTLLPAQSGAAATTGAPTVTAAGGPDTWTNDGTFSGFEGRRWLHASAQLPGGTTDVRWPVPAPRLDGRPGMRHRYPACHPRIPCRHGS